MLSNENCQITVLLSPVNNINAEDVQINQVGNVEVCKNVPDLSHFFKTAGVIVASYGHLAYEAMSYMGSHMFSWSKTISNRVCKAA